MIWIRVSINYTTELKFKDFKAKATSSTYSANEKKEFSKEEIELLIKKLIQEQTKEVRKEASRERYILPQMGEKAVLKLPLDERPTLDLSDEEIRRIHKISPKITAKILKNQIAWEGYADIADSAIEGYQNYLRSLFGGEKAK